MTKYHEWKRRLWGGEFPFENGPPYVDPGTGAPILPGGIQDGPYQGVNDDAPQAGNPVALTITGPGFGDGQINVLIDDRTASAPTTGRWVGASYQFWDGNTADVIAAALAADFTARNWDGWIGAVAAGATVTFTPQAAGTATGYVLYTPFAKATQISLPTPIPGDFVQGPFTTKGKKYWVQREAGKWYVWFDVDPDVDPDVRVDLAAYLADPAHSEYAQAIRRKARNFGYEG